MKEGLPSLVGSQAWRQGANAGRKAGSEYLNIQFGWLPIVNDIRKFADAVSHADTVLAQYERDSNKQVRRRYNFPSQRELSPEIMLSSDTSAFTLIGSSVIGPGAPRGSLVRIRETIRKQWFSGAFVYHLPTGYDSRSELARLALQAKKLYGLTLTPEVVWNLAPWSWAVDWFSNAGDVLSNISDMATDGLVMRYGYLMEHTITKDTYRLAPPFKNGGGTVPPLTLVRETKVRRRANPFGFGVSWDGLSPRQLAITVALGLSRS
jgi:hypothetical protein